MILRGKQYLLVPVLATLSVSTRAMDREERLLTGFLSPPQLRLRSRSGEADLAGQDKDADLIDLLATPDALG